MAKIFLSVPVGTRPELGFMHGLNLAIANSKHDIRLNWMEGHPVITSARNTMISQYINDFVDYDYYMTLDDDLFIVNYMQDNNIFDKLVDMNEEFCGAVYACRNDAPWSCATFFRDGEDVAYNTGYKRVRWLTGGCQLITRNAILTMVREYPDLKFIGNVTTNGKPIYALYNPIAVCMDDGRKCIYEDYAICERWNQLGGDIKIDTSIVLGHSSKQIKWLWEEAVCQCNR